MALRLEKGQRISLKKEDGSNLQNFCVGANWGAIETKGLFGRPKKEAVDLDLSVGIFDDNKNLIDKVYYGKKRYPGIYHSGDDLTGDLEGDDGLDNEVIQVNLKELPENVAQLVFVLNSFKKQDFADIPFARIRLYEGTPDKVQNVVAEYEVSKDPKYAGHVSMILGKLYKKNGEWKFAAIGEPTKDRNLDQTLQTVKEYYL
jgi:tellurium resistance protein TerZ